MSFKKPVASLIAVAIMAAFSGSAVFAADSTTTTSTTSTTSTSSGAASGKLASTYSTFAGSDANSKALVDGLRNGTSITLKSSSTGGTTSATGGTTGTTGGTTGTTSGSVTFTPKTSKLGFGNVNIALALAKAELTKMGITNPTPAQIEAALNGGTITTSKGSTKVDGILAQRADGKGWGQIAKSMGFKLGEVVSASKTGKPGEAAERRTAAAKERADAKAAKADAKAERAAKTEKVEKAEKVAKVEKMERPQKIDRPEKIDRPVKVERPERAERPQK
jgi:hypothetical protein